jgi:hypothetical protein
MRSMTAAFSADPERKYRAAVSMDACPSMAWTWAGSQQHVGGPDSDGWPDTLTVITASG